MILMQALALSKFGEPISQREARPSLFSVRGVRAGHGYARRGPGIPEWRHA